MEPSYPTSKNKKRRVSHEPSEIMGEVSNTEYGRLVWAKIPGFRVWPGMVINGVEDCSREAPSSSKIWIYWFGDHRISLGSTAKTYDFALNFEKFYQSKGNNSNTGKEYKTGIKELLLECRKRACLPSNIENTKEMIQWAVEGFTPVDYPFTQFFLKPGSAYPAKISRDIALIRERNHWNGEIDSKSLVYFPTSSSSSESDSDSEERKLWRSKAILIKKARTNKEILENMCIGCEKCEDAVVVQKHPWFHGGLCRECVEEHNSSQNRIGEDGVCYFCAVCSSPGETIVCDNDQCDKVFCVGCIELFVSPVAVDKIKSTDPWMCFLCTQYTEVSHGVILPRPEYLEWRSNFQKSTEDHRSKYNDKFNWLDNCNETFDWSNDEQKIDLSTWKKRPLRVLSLFDGISTGLYVLEKLGIEVEKYYSSEVDENAINVAKMNFGEKISFLGDVRLISDKKVKSLCPIDLLIGGSPCNDLSIVNPNRKGLYDMKGSGYLFFHFFRILKVIEKHNEYIFWLFENVNFMPKIFKQEMCLFFQRKPVVVDAIYFSPQKRARLFWGNIPGMSAPINREIQNSENLKLADVVMKVCGRSAEVEKINCVTTNRNSLLINGGSFPISMSGKPDVPWITELEKIFGFPAHYTDVGNLGVLERQKLLGKCWSAQVIQHFFRNFRSYFTFKNEIAADLNENIVGKIAEKVCVNEKEVGGSSEIVYLNESKVDASAENFNLHENKVSGSAEQNYLNKNGIGSTNEKNVCLNKNEARAKAEKDYSKKRKVVINAQEATYLNENEINTMTKSTSINESEVSAAYLKEKECAKGEKLYLNKNGADENCSNVNSANSDTVPQNKNIVDQSTREICFGENKVGANSGNLNLGRLEVVGQKEERRISFDQKVEGRRKDEDNFDRGKALAISDKINLNKTMVIGNKADLNKNNESDDKKLSLKENKESKNSEELHLNRAKAGTSAGEFYLNCNVTEGSKRVMLNNLPDQLNKVDEKLENDRSNPTFEIEDNSVLNVMDETKVEKAKTTQNILFKVEVKITTIEKDAQNEYVSNQDISNEVFNEKVAHNCIEVEENHKKSQKSFLNSFNLKSTTEFSCQKLKIVDVTTEIDRYSPEIC